MSGNSGVNLEERSATVGFPLTTTVTTPIPKVTPLPKVVFDLVFSVFLLIIFSLPLLCVAALIKIDSPGPVFFRQPRIGLGNKQFLIWKFRTMHQHSCDIDGAQLTKRDDNRITPVGKILRKWSIDEVPQIFNVLSGDMSMVGPRPHTRLAGVGDQPYSSLVPDYHLRHCVKPGITGLAQVSGWRGETTKLYQIEQRVKHDLYYIKNWSMWLDMKIIIATITKEIWSPRAF